MLGGTFDPIHLGHLRAAEAARESLALGAVWFVPAGRPPHKREPVAPALDRFAMVSLATAEQPGFVASDLELRREGPSYTVDTVAAVRAERPDDELFLIVGSDTLPEMAAWKEPERLFALCAIGVVARPGAAALAPVPGQRVSRVGGPCLPVSASEVRQLLKARRSARYLVPPPVADYIEKRGLYL